MRSMIDYASGLDESGHLSERDRKVRERLARIAALETQMKNTKFNAPPSLIELMGRDIDKERKALQEETAQQDEPEEAPMPAEQEILAENLTEEQRAQARAAIAKITDLDAAIVEACGYTAPKLVGVFNQATEYHNKIANSFSELENVRRQNSLRTGGTYASSHTLYDYGVDAVKIQAKIDFYNHSLTRLAQGITTRAVLQTVKGLRPGADL